MIIYRIKRSYKEYVLQKYAYLDKSIGFTKIYSGTRVEVLKYIKENNIRVGGKWKI